MAATGVDVWRSLLGYPTRQKVSDAVATAAKEPDKCPDGVIASVSMRSPSTLAQSIEEQFHTTRALDYAASWTPTQLKRRRSSARNRSPKEQQSQCLN